MFSIITLHYYTDIKKKLRRGRVKVNWPVCCIVDNLPNGSNRNISYTVHNIGSTSQTYLVSLTIFGEISVNGLTSKTIQVNSNSTEDGNFIIKGKKIG